MKMAGLRIELLRVAEIGDSLANATPEQLLLKILELNERSASGERSLALEEEQNAVEERLLELKMLEDLKEISRLQATSLFGRPKSTGRAPTIPGYVAERLVPIYH